MKKVKIVLSDLHLGKGKFLPNGTLNVLEQFDGDDQLIELLQYYSSGEFQNSDVEFIANGDFFDTIQIDYKGYFPDVITERISREKMKGAINGHRKLFDALKEFNSDQRHAITFLTGNHDPDILWDGVRSLLRDTIGGRVYFHNISYEFDGIYIEHGNQYEAVNKFETKHFFLSKDLPEPILNLPWASLFIINYLTKMKRTRPWVDRVRPFRLMLRWAFFNDLIFFFNATSKMIFYFIQTRFRSTKTRYTNLRTTFKILKEITLFEDMTHFAKKLFDVNPNLNAIIFGHTHVHTYYQFENAKEYFNTGTWNSITSLQIDSYGHYRHCAYCLIEYKDGSPHPKISLKEWKGKWRETIDVLS